jgi:hypothetical protein
VKIAVRVIPLESGERAGEIGALIGIELRRESVMRGRGSCRKQDTKNDHYNTEELVSHESLLEKEYCLGPVLRFLLDVDLTTLVSKFISSLLGVMALTCHRKRFLNGRPLLRLQVHVAQEVGEARVRTQGIKHLILADSGHNSDGLNGVVIIRWLLVLIAIWKPT